ncbi:hypothetical protein [Nonomuraea gerenzanensis]|uniref:Uncharacterized protein n=1 Tax=Nonomuraea gerenzanensis TaxID=93944 RepID=A0A1M4E8I1_9ACTN|nr:hypothetical protein [Nonomuraea gerenzanensis]UBU17407.1 hypothetical protein LCN96_20990 [Nonomuraea gerenzanensis]SBO95160.1 hypothetical protein BN4615_P4676 [Nonomuraea gerenzanensis]
MALADAGIRRLLVDSGEPRGWVSPRADLVTALLGVWFGVGLMIDAWAHTNQTELETFFTPWHAVFYSGFAVVSGWILWQVWQNVRAGRQGLAAVPTGYLAGLVAVPAFAAFGFADMMWHTILGIETSLDILFSPSHLGLIVTMLLIITTPLRSAWNAPDLGARPTLGRLLPALIGLAFATTLVSLFLSYGDAMQYRAPRIVKAFSSVNDPGADRLALAMVVTNVVILSPVLLLVRRWVLPFGSVTVMYAIGVLMPGAQTEFENVPVLVSFVVAGLVSDLLIRWLRPSGERRGAYWAFAGLSAFATWALYIGIASVAGGGLPAVPELWTGAPIIAGLIGLALGALFLPNAVTAQPGAVVAQPGAVGAQPGAVVPQSGAVGAQQVQVSASDAERA